MNPVASPSLHVLTGNQVLAEVPRWLHSQQVSGLSGDSRQLQPGEAFFALHSLRHKSAWGHVEAAIAAGARALVVEASEMPTRSPPLPCLLVPELKPYLGPLAREFYGAPDAAMTVAAITGTNGKTTVCQWLAQALAVHQGQALALGTLGVLHYQRGETSPLTYAESGLTSLLGLDLFRYLARGRDQGVSAVVLEASSIGIVEGRLKGLALDLAIFTNLTQDHLDFHGDMAHYEAAKTALFDTPNLTQAVINLDDPMGLRLVQHLGQRQHHNTQAPCLWGFTLETDIAAAAGLDHVVSAAPRGAADSQLQVRWQQQGRENRIDIPLPSIGRFNMSNALAVVTALFALGLTPVAVVQAMAGLRPPPGRLEVVRQAPLTVVDFAHTPDALKNVIATLLPLARERQGQLYCVFGCGGNRDSKKRALMGAVAEMADQVFVTSDNPRDEDPLAIATAIVSGMTRRPHIELDRARAIALALDSAWPEDVVLIAGKGHEDSQEIAGRFAPFQDAAVVRAWHPGSGNAAGAKLQAGGNHA